jgi:hypothetical protein
MQMPCSCSECVVNAGLELWEEMWMRLGYGMRKLGMVGVWRRRDGWRVGRFELNCGCLNSVYFCFDEVYEILAEGIQSIASGLHHIATGLAGRIDKEWNE